MDGASGYIYEVVWFLRPASAGPGSLDHFGEMAGSLAVRVPSAPCLGTQPRALAPLTNSNIDISRSSMHPNSFSLGSHLVFYNDHLRPPLPNLNSTGDVLVPAEAESLMRLDTPLCFYRSSRLLRTLHQLPRSHVLPQASNPVASSVASVSSFGMPSAV